MPRFLLVASVLMSGTSAIAANNKVLSLNNSANVAVIEDDGVPGDAFAQIRSLNGTFSTQRFRLPTNQLTIYLRGGDDQLTIDGTGLPALTASILIRGGGGNDSMTVQSIDVGGDVASNDWSGDNSLLVRGATIRGDIEVVDGAGFQSLRITNQALVRGDVIVTSSNGGSTIASGNQGIGTASVLGSVLIQNAGFGDDNLEVFGSVTGDYFADTGNGNVTFRSFFSSLRQNVSLLVDTGSLSFTTAESVVDGDFEAVCLEGPMSSRFLNTRVEGFTDLRSFLGYDEHYWLNFETPQMRVQNGDGGSCTEILDGFVGVPFRSDIKNLRIINGAGADELEIKRLSSFGPNAGPQIGSLTVTNGSGNSRLELQSGIRVGSIRQTNGDGFDTISLAGATVDRELVSLNNSGGSELTVEDSSIGGVTNVQSRSGRDYFSLIDSVFGNRVSLRMGGSRDTLTVFNSTFASNFVANAGSGFDTFESAGDYVVGGIEYLIGFENILAFE